MMTFIAKLSSTTFKAGCALLSLSVLLAAPSFAESFEQNSSTVSDLNALTKQYVQGVNLKLNPSAHKLLNNSQVDLLVRQINKVTAEVKTLLPEFPEHIDLQVSLVARNLDKVGGVTGVAQTPTSVNIEISQNYKLGLTSAIKKGLVSTLFHEYHHLARGWTIEGNKFGPGVAIASVNEGLASVFADKYGGVLETWSAYPDSVSDWVDEILDLPLNASYETWMMGAHPDGRHNVGYRAGKYIIHQAMKKSGLSIIELSEFGPFEIMDMSGVIKEHGPSLAKLGDYYAKNKQAQAAIDSYHRAIKATPNTEQTLLSRYQKKINLIQHPVVLSKEQRNNLVGTYSSDKLSLSVFLSPTAEQLTVQLPGKPSFELLAETAQLFFINEADVTFEFVQQKNNLPTKLTVNLFGRKMELLKTL